MARLNEPPAPTAESIDSLKRRFVRQNKELARSNSTQSVKIRALETQLSQLAAENVSLRSTVVQLQLEIDGSRQRNVADNVNAVKQKLEEKLREFGNLVAELSDVNKRPAAAKRAPEERVSRATSNGGGILEGREGWLPTISEGKHFPRHTFEPSEIGDLLAGNSSDSPDLGPPPQQSLDILKSNDDLPEPVKGSAEGQIGHDGSSGLLSANLETRRRRRESGVHRDSAISNNIELSSAKESDSSRPPELWTTQPIRVGSKRKLDVANRPSAEAKPALKDKDNSISGRSDQDDEIFNTKDAQKSLERRVLAPKSVNTDPTSPKKVTDKTTPQDTTCEKRTAKQNAQKARFQHTDAMIEVMEQGGKPLETIEIALDLPKVEPKTPAPPDLFSPASTEVSTKPSDGRDDTPPPANIGTRSAIGGDGTAAGRPSRRARASVNYAEPNLISKMRRPTKEFTEAVRSGQKRSESVSAEQPDNNSERMSRNQAQEAAAAEINGDNLSTEVVKDRPEQRSPLQKKEEQSKGNIVFDLSNARDRRNSGLHQTCTASTEQEQTGSSVAISTLIGSRKGTRERENFGSSSLEDALEKLDIFDVAPSPEPSLISKVNSESKRANSAASIRSNSDSTQKNPRQTASSSSSTSNRARNRRQTLDSGSEVAVKPSRSTTSYASSEAADKNFKPSRNAATSMGRDARAEKKTTAERIAENTAARRRSMML